MRHPQISDERPGTIAPSALFAPFRAAIDFFTGHRKMPLVMRPRWMLPVVVVGLVVAASCKKDSKQEAGTFKIGVITSLTGSQAAFGQAHKNGYTIALGELNAKGGVLGKPIEILFYDD